MAKAKLTVLVPEDLADEVRDAVVALSGPPLRLTLAQLAENALRTEVERLKKQHNKGKAFPAIKSPLRGGRPVGR